MPNGHGGVPRFFSPFLLLLALALLLYFRVARDAQWTLYLALLAGILLSWRLAWHIHLYGPMEYGGTYTPREILEPARTRYRRTLLLLLPLMLILVYTVWA